MLWTCLKVGYKNSKISNDILWNASSQIIKKSHKQFTIDIALNNIKELIKWEKSMK